jgi:cysteine synthase A
LARHDERELTAVAIAPDLGERYLDTVYHTNWLQTLYGEDVLGSDEPTAGEPAAWPPHPRGLTWTS